MYDWRQPKKKKRLSAERGLEWRGRRNGGATKKIRGGGGCSALKGHTSGRLGGGITDSPRSGNA